MKPIIAVLGTKDTGKTSLMVNLIKILTAKGYSILAAKHISHNNFSFDKADTDSYRFATSGASKVFILSPSKWAVYKTKAGRDLELNDLVKLSEGEDLILLEGFTDWVQDKPYVAKIICSSLKEENDNKLQNVKEPIIGRFQVNSSESEAQTIKKTNIIVEKVLEYIQEIKNVSLILAKLPKLDCKACGYSDCFTLAKMINLKKDSVEKCVVLKDEKESNVEVTVNGKKIPLKRFAAEVVKKTVFGLVSSFKTVEPLENKRKLKIIID